MLLSHSMAGFCIRIFHFSLHARAYFDFGCNFSLSAYFSDAWWWPHLIVLIISFVLLQRADFRFLDRAWISGCTFRIGQYYFLIEHHRYTLIFGLVNTFILPISFTSRQMRDDLHYISLTGVMLRQRIDINICMRHTGLGKMYVSCQPLLFKSFFSILIGDIRLIFEMLFSQAI